MNCDPIARHYAWMEFAVFGRTLERCRTQLLPDLGRPRRALVLGDGDGRFLAQFLKSVPDLQADYVDRSGRMLQRARTRSRDAGVESRVQFHTLDALNDPLPAGDFDLVTAHFFFDCFGPEDLRRVIERVRNHAPEARWLVSEFRVPGGKWWAPLAVGWIGVMYRFFAVTTGLKTRRLEDHRPWMQRAGLQRTECVEWAGGMLISELWVPKPSVEH